MIPGSSAAKSPAPVGSRRAQPKFEHLRERGAIGAADGARDPARIGVVIGTRPEAVKLAPVVWALDANQQTDPVVIDTGQHRELLKPILADLSIAASHRLDAIGPGGLAGLTSRLTQRFGELFSTIAALDALVVQGDTTSAMCGALAAFYEGIPVGHVEAGLRSGDLTDPFPEELNRRMIAIASRWHFAPTALAARNLEREQIPSECIHVTGNTVIDTLKWANREGVGKSAFRTPGLRILATLHRRETQGPQMRALGEALASIAAQSGAEVVLPLHMNPIVRNSLMPPLEDAKGVALVEPLDYFDFIATMRESHLLLTDSGGVLEEASSVGVPVVICREVTERPEAVTAGNAVLAGTDKDSVIREAMNLIESDERRKRMSQVPSPFGSGRAGVQIAAALAQDLRPGVPESAAGRPGPTEH